MAFLFLEYIDCNKKFYTCAGCDTTHLATRGDIISKAFRNGDGRAYLFDKAVNTYTGPAVERLLLTGFHCVCDIFCCKCHTKLGWFYVEAYEQSQKYKVGKFVLEKQKIKKNW
jgi:hypothetical protein